MSSAKRAELTEEAGRSGKPEAVIAKMIEGRMRRFFDETVLLRQPYVLNPDQSFEEALREAEAAAGAPIVVSGFAHLKVGEGIVKPA